MQLQQGMAGHSWEPEDWAWRPLWTPSMRDGQGWGAEPGTDVGEALLQTLCANSTGTARRRHGGSRSESAAAAACDTSLRAHAGVLARLTQAAAELEAPQRGLRLAQDAALLTWYQGALTKALSQAVKDGSGSSDSGGGSVSGPLVLVLSHGGGGLLGLLAAHAGAGTVVVVEQGRWGYQAATQLLGAQHGEAMRAAAARVVVAPVPLERCRCADAVTAAAEGRRCDRSSTTAVGGGAPTADELDFFELPAPADVVVVTDMLDHAVFGSGLLPCLDAAAAAGLLKPGAGCVPARITVHAQLVDAVLPRGGFVAGFDLGLIDQTYRWHPTLEKLDLDR